MTEREALLRAVCENPDDDTPRLVFADWLDENGEPERAEFIRLQVRLAGMYREATPGTEAIEKKVREMWLRHGAVWRALLPRIPGVRWHDAFQRGFPDHVTVDADKTLVAHSDEVFSRVPARHMIVSHFLAVTGFADLTPLRRLRTFSARNDRPSDATIRRLLECDHFSDSVLLNFDFGLHGTEWYAELRAKFGARLHAPAAPPSSRPR